MFFVLKTQKIKNFAKKQSFLQKKSKKICTYQKKVVSLQRKTKRNTIMTTDFTISQDFSSGEDKTIRVTMALKNNGRTLTQSSLPLMSIAELEQLSAVINNYLDKEGL